MGVPRPVERNLAAEFSEDADDEDQGVAQGERPPLVPRATRNADTPSANKVLAQLGGEMMRDSKWMKLFAPVPLAQERWPSLGPLLAGPMEWSDTAEVAETAILLLKAMGFRVTSRPSPWILSDWNLGLALGAVTLEGKAEKGFWSADQPRLLTASDGGSQLGEKPSNTPYLKDPKGDQPATNPTKITTMKTHETKKGERFRATAETPYFEDSHMLSPKKSRTQLGQNKWESEEGNSAEAEEDSDDDHGYRPSRDETVKDQIYHLSNDRGDQGGSQYLELRSHVSLDKIAQFDGRRYRSDDSLQWLKRFIYEMKVHEVGQCELFRRYEKLASFVKNNVDKSKVPEELQNLYTPTEPVVEANFVFAFVGEAGWPEGSVGTDEGMCDSDGNERESEESDEDDSAMVSAPATRRYDGVTPRPRVVKLLRASDDEPAAESDHRFNHFEREGETLHLEDYAHELAFLPDLTHTPEQATRLTELLKRNKKIMISSGNAIPPPAYGVVCDIDVGDNPPIKRRARRVALKYLKPLYELLKGLLRAKLVSFSKSLRASNIVIVLKKNGVDIRLCIDYKKVTAITMIMEYAMPLVNDLLSELEKYLFIQNLAVYGAVLNQLKDSDFEGNKDLSAAQAAFAELKSRVATAPILHHFDSAEEVHIMLFTNDWALSSTLMQMHDDKLHPESLEHIAPPSKNSASIRLNPELLYAKLPRHYKGHVLSFDGSAAKTEKNGGYGSWSWILWRLPEWDIEIAASAYLSSTTVNLAEYTGMNNGVKAAIDRGVTDLVIVGDSRLANQQSMGVIACKKETLQVELARHKELTKN
ncbi:Hypothetical protein PHPALM_9154 [Phytophthora palmivora]|uniref:RNase H type-1 domain-containing protein n=1 Tax=Phytophthora palmivora TaxID=4796 RepID=A0A2P4Y805_9STRA|nr:Hypothetical protein PHPALM_9154 [Phytophthora palmivora]